MRLGPVLVPSTIVVAIGVIIAAQSDWFDGSASVPTFLVQGDHAGHGAPSASDLKPTIAATPAPAVSLPSSVAQDPEPTAVGRSVGRNIDDARPARAGSALGAGGASLDTDGDGAPAHSPDRAAASAPDTLQQARDEAAKAKQDVLDVTQASISAQHASEAEFERQKAELNEQIAQMRAKIDAASAQPAGAAATAEAKAATAMAELVDARERENGLRAKLAVAQAAVSTDAAGKESADKLAAAERARAEVQGHAKELEAEVAALQAGAAAGRMAEDKLAISERAFTDAQARVRASADKVAALESELATKASAERTTADAQANAADRLAADLAVVRQREDALKDQVATLQVGAAETARAQGAEATAVRKVSALQQQLEDAGAREKDLGVKLVALQAGIADGETRAKQASESAARSATLQQQLAASELRGRDLGVKLAALQQDVHSTTGARSPDVQALQNDLAGARRGEDTLRRENSVLQGELTSQRAATRLLADKLAVLQAGVGQPMPPDDLYRHGRAQTSSRKSDHERLVRELAALRREQMHQELEGLRVEADSLGRSNGSRRQANRGKGRAVRIGTVQPVLEPPLPPEGHATRRREKQVLRERDAAYGPPPAARESNRFSALRNTAGGADESGGAIAQAGGLIRSGDIDQARQVLRNRGGAAATRALADTYNPLTNTQYGAIGVDSDADKAAYLYEQANRSGR